MCVAQYFQLTRAESHKHSHSHAQIVSHSLTIYLLRQLVYFFRFFIPHLHNHTHTLAHSCKQFFLRYIGTHTHTQSHLYTCAHSTFTSHERHTQVQFQHFTNQITRKTLHFAHRVLGQFPFARRSYDEVSGSWYRISESWVLGFLGRTNHTHTLTMGTIRVYVCTYVCCVPRSRARAISERSAYVCAQTQQARRVCDGRVETAHESV